MIGKLADEGREGGSVCGFPFSWAVGNWSEGGCGEGRGRGEPPVGGGWVDGCSLKLSERGGGGGLLPPRAPALGSY